jgi:glycerophosphoryl diester phosphodiesterase
MGTPQRRPASRGSLLTRITLLLTIPTVLGALVAPGPASSANPARSTGSAGSAGSESWRAPTLVGRAVLPFDTLAPGPPAGDFVVPGPGTVNGVTFPLASQPVEGFSSIVDGRRRGEFLAMPDNGFGSKANSPDFLIRAYFIRPHFKTSRGGSGTVHVGEFISFRDPDHRMPFPIVNEATSRRLLTGGDIDPESLQRGRNGDLWVGDEFGPWILHFSARGRLLDPPYAVPGITSPNNPTLVPGEDATQPNSRGFEAMAISRRGRFLYAALEGATVADPDQTRRNVYRFSVERGVFTPRVRHYRTEAPGTLVADMWAIGRHRVVVIERDAGSGLNALFRRVYRVDLRHPTAEGFLRKTRVVDLTAIRDPDLVSLPPLHPGDVGLGDPFRVVCESVEAVHLIGGHRLLVGCDNNLPNSGRNPSRPDDNEFIVVDVPGLRSVG